MRFEWDEKKRKQVFEKHKVDLLYAALIFEGVVLTRIDDREDYGEVREISLGTVEGESFVVVHTERDGVTRLITAWKGGHDECDQYEDGIARRSEDDERTGKAPI